MRGSAGPEGKGKNRVKSIGQKNQLDLDYGEIAV